MALNPANDEGVSTEDCDWLDGKPPRSFAASRRIETITGELEFTAEKRAVESLVEQGDRFHARESLDGALGKFDQGNIRMRTAYDAPDPEANVRRLRADAEHVFGSNRAVGSAQNPDGRDQHATAVREASCRKHLAGGEWQSGWLLMPPACFLSECTAGEQYDSNDERSEREGHASIHAAQV